MVLVLLDLRLEFIRRDLVVLDDKIDLKLLDREGQRNPLGGTPDETINLNGTDVGFELVNVGLVILNTN